MRQRWLPFLAIAIGLFAINVATRLIVRWGFNGNETAESRASLIMFALVGAVLAGVAFARSRNVPPSTWLPELAVTAIIGLLLTILVGPFVSGDLPFSGGAGNFFSQVWLYAGFAIVGTLLGYWIATAMGVDYKSRSLQAFARAKLAKPRRVVRR
jgi:lipoprotein signal peptidase